MGLCKLCNSRVIEVNLGNISVCAVCAKHLNGVRIRCVYCGKFATSKESTCVNIVSHGAINEKCVLGRGYNSESSVIEKNFTYFLCGNRYAYIVCENCGHTIPANFICRSHILKMLSKNYAEAM